MKETPPLEGPRVSRSDPANENDWREILRGNILFLGLVSFFTDFSSEVIYPLLPVFFAGLVGSATAPVYIGLMDGLAETVSSLVKIFSGKYSDQAGVRKPLVLLGYGISSLIRPLAALAVAGWQIILVRFLDRIGKGLRSSPRDALLSESVTPGVRARAFSFHRLMDHAGAFFGPICALGFLWFTLGSGLLWRAQTDRSVSMAEMEALRWLFGLALIPGMISLVVLWTGVTEAKHLSPPEPSSETLANPPLPRDFKMFLGVMVLFTLGNSSDLFLVFLAREKFGLGLGWMLFFWLWLHLSKMAWSLPGGVLADRHGRRPLLLGGWILYSLVYFLFPFASSPAWFLCLLFVYGSYYGFTEGAEKALVADIVPPRQRGQAFGWFHASVGLATLPASLVFGFLYTRAGAWIAFHTGATLALVAALLLWCSPMEKRDVMPTGGVSPSPEIQTKVMDE